MRIVIAGGTGFLGRALQGRLRHLGHTVTTLTRRPRTRDQEQWTPDGGTGPWAAALDGADAVVNLAGEGIADARWTAARKDALRSSRVLSTRSIVAAIRGAATPPVLLNASGIGYYGDRGTEIVTEDTAAGTDFLADLCVEWEREAGQAAPHTRVVCLRNGLVMHPSGGALQKMLLPFRLGAGGRLGSGAQYLPWIHLDDWLDLIVRLMTTADARGAFNVTAPEPATNAEFTRALGRALRRPAVIPVPAFALRLALGELADTLLTGQRAVPARATNMGFPFRFNEIDPALRDLLRR
ncbi:MAG TPA: TIGR01777 family oxidoreductase [Vicinamibacterales bacterium]|nr:TIGR01777 family oxidoreductase [Vicinamibacterales bacterium]